MLKAESVCGCRSVQKQHTRVKLMYKSGLTRKSGFSFSLSTATSTAPSLTHLLSLAFSLCVSSAERTMWRRGRGRTSLSRQTVHTGTFRLTHTHTKTCLDTVYSNVTREPKYFSGPLRNQWILSRLGTSPKLFCFAPEYCLAICNYTSDPSILILAFLLKKIS